MADAKTNGVWQNLGQDDPRRHAPPKPPIRLLVIGAGSRGNGYAKAVGTLQNAVISSIAEPIQAKRESFIKKHISANGHLREDQEFKTWQGFVEYENGRRERQRAGDETPPGIDGAFICTLDHTHVRIVEALAPFGIHIMCEKPLATNLEDCRRIYRALKCAEAAGARAVFSTGHVLRYSPHNMLLKQLIEGNMIGDILSIEHTEPIGFWHFAHSYVRGNWRKESVTAPSLLTKSCHDVDFILWIMSVAFGGSVRRPTSVSSNGSLLYFRKSRKPVEAGPATNCLSCNFESQCIYSAKRIYVDHHLIEKEKLGWPVDIVEPEIEECWRSLGKDAAKDKLISRLAEDYDDTTPAQTVDRRPWFGRCVYEAANDVCDDQMVLFAWDDEASGSSEDKSDHANDWQSRIASFHMVAFTEKQCERRGRIYGTRGEIEYDGSVIRVHDFPTQKTAVHHPTQEGGGHGGGDFGLTRQFVRAIHGVRDMGESIESAQRRYIGATLEDMIQSHVLVFAVEDARIKRKQLQCDSWWQENFADGI